MTGHQVGMDVARIAADDELEGNGCIDAEPWSVRCVLLLEKGGDYFSNLVSGAILHSLTSRIVQLFDTPPMFSC